MSARIVKLPEPIKINPMSLDEKSPGKRFIEVLFEHLNKEARENNLSSHTQDMHKAHLINIIKFLCHFKMSEISVSDVRIRHLEAFKLWMYNNTGCKTHEHVTRHIKLCINAVDYAVRMEYLPYNSLSSTKLKRDRAKPVIYLEPHELIRLVNYNPENNLWQKVVDVFLFQCYTGLSYMDLSLFELVDDSIIGEEKEISITWITCSKGRGKTKRPYWAEFTQEARQIYEKHEGELPFVCLQTYNKTIKKIAKELEINKNITTHIGRKTFANLKNSMGYSTPAIADMLGNTEKVARTHYISQTKKRIESEIIRLRRAG